MCCPKTKRLPLAPGSDATGSQQVQEGRSLAGAMAEFPDVFPEIYQATIDAGERSGQLDLVLERLADYTEFKQQLRRKMILALTYPLLLSLVALLILRDIEGIFIQFFRPLEIPKVEMAACNLCEQKDLEH